MSLWTLVGLFQADRRGVELTDLELVTSHRLCSIELPELCSPVTTDWSAFGPAIGCSFCGTRAEAVIGSLIGMVCWLAFWHRARGESLSAWRRAAPRPFGFREALQPLTGNWAICVMEREMGAPLCVWHRNLKTSELDEVCRQMLSNNLILLVRRQLLLLRTYFVAIQLSTLNIYIHYISQVLLQWTPWARKGAHCTAVSSAKALRARIERAPHWVCEFRVVCL